MHWDLGRSFLGRHGVVAVHCPGLEGREDKAGDQVGGVDRLGGVDTGPGRDGAAAAESLIEALLGGGVCLQMRHCQPQRLVNALIGSNATLTLSSRQYVCYRAFYM